MLADSSLDMMKTAWEQPYTTGWSMGIYSNIVHNSSFCSRNWRMHIIVVYRVHMPKVKLSSIFPNITPTCNKCINSDATLIHPWVDVFKTISNILGQDPVPHPLGIPERNYLNPTSAEWYMITFTSRLARCAVLPRWKDAAPSIVISGSKDIKYWFKLGMRRFSAMGPFLTYYPNTQTTKCGIHSSSDMKTNSLTPFLLLLLLRC